jgi:hyperosmotically inducible periplasmic protein
MNTQRSLLALAFLLGACDPPRPAQSTQTTSSTSEVQYPRTVTSPAQPAMPATGPAGADGWQHPQVHTDTSPTPGPADTTTGTRPSAGVNTGGSGGTNPGGSGASNQGGSGSTPRAVPNESAKPDNTKVNERDRQSTLTPLSQGNSSAEVKITAAIRRNMMGDKSLSFNAKNAKVITTGTKVTLRGPVNSEQEKAAIELFARNAAGVTEVDNQLDVKK